MKHKTQSSPNEHHKYTEKKPRIRKRGQTEPGLVAMYESS